MLLAGLLAMALEGGACAPASSGFHPAPSARPPVVTASVPAALVSVPLGKSAVLRSSARCRSSSAPQTADLRKPAVLQVLPRLARATPDDRADQARSRRRRLRAHAPPSISGVTG